MMSSSEAYRLIMLACGDTNQDIAVRQLRLALLQDPTSKLAHYHLGMILAARGLHPEAIEHFSRIVTDIDLNDAGSSFLLARQFHLNGELEIAVSQYQHTLELDPLCEK